MRHRPLVTVVVPMLNEEPDISGCLEAIGAQTYPRSEIEVVVVDGGSRDRSVEIAAEILARSSGYRRAEVISNPHGNTPSNLNRGLAWSTGDIVARVDARSFIAPHYVEEAVRVLETRPDVAVVGGAQVARAARGAGLQARAIARALRNPYLTGFSRYRRAGRSGSSDTVYLGVFRRAQLQALGGWDERLGTNQDYDLNRRMASLGTVWFESSLATTYRPRNTFVTLFRQYHRFGRWKAAVWLETGQISRRHVALLTIAASIAGFVPFWVTRAPFRRGGLILLGALAVEDRVGERAGIALRVLSIWASVTSVGGWLLGIARQVTGFFLGERLLNR
jgi:succinoglycan biosynthesis protein ExoA